MFDAHPPVGDRSPKVPVLLALLFVLVASSAAAQSVLVVEKEFLADPVSAGSEVILEFRIFNYSETASLLNIAFNDDLGAVLPPPGGELLPLNLPLTDPCGEGSSLVGAVGFVDFFNGTLPPGGSCSFQVRLGVPLETPPGTYTNTTNTPTAFSSPGGFVSGSPATDDLEVTEAEILQKTFLGDPVAAPTTVPLQFVLTNPSPTQTLTGVAFTDDLDTVLSGLVATNLPLFDVCGSGSMVTGTDFVEFTGGRLAPGVPCSFTVDVAVPAGAAAGAYLNVTSSVSANLGTTEGGPVVIGAPAEDLLEVGIPGLTKSFTDDPVAAGDTVTLQFTITNVHPTDAYNALQFDDDLQAVVSGLEVIDPLPLLDVCGAGSSLENLEEMEPVGSSFIGLRNGSLGGGESCSFSVTLAVPLDAPVGSHRNVTSELWIGGVTPPEGLFAIGSPAEDDLQIVGAPELVKVFVDDPVAPGGATVELEFTLTSTDTVNRTRNIAFTDDLNAVVAGLAAPDLLTAPMTDVCGVGSQLAAGSGGTNASFLEFTGGELAPGASCTFSVTLAVPAGAGPGAYPNTTSAPTAEIGGRPGSPGIPVTGTPAADDLDIATVPILTKSFTDDPVAAGDTVTLEFTVLNTSTTDSATDIAFTDDLGLVLPPGYGPLAPQGLPLADVCGSGSTLDAVPPTGGAVLPIALSGGTLAPSSSCTFAVTLQVPADAPAGNFLNTTSQVTATLGGVAVAGQPATDSLQILQLPSFGKAFSDALVLPGASVELQFTIALEDSVVGVGGMAFTDDLAAVLPGLSAVGLPLNDVCGPGSQIAGTSVLSFTNGSLPPDTQCVFQVTVLVPAGATGGTYTNVTSSLDVTVSGTAAQVAPATADLAVAGDVRFSKAFLDDPVSPGAVVDLEFTIENVSPTDGVSGLFFQDNLNAVMPGLVPLGLPLADACGVGSTLLDAGNVLVLTGGSLGPLETCTFSVSLQLPGDVPAGRYVNTTSSLIGSGVEVAPPARAFLTVSGLLELTKTFLADPVLPGETVDLEFTVSYSGQIGPLVDITFTDDLDGILPGLAAVGLPAADVCGAGSMIDGTGFLTLTGGTLGAQSSCTFTVTLQVPADAQAPQTVQNTTSPVTASVLPTEGDVIQGPPATDTLEIDATTVLVKSFVDDPVPPGGTATLEFTVTNVNTASSAIDIAFTDDLDAVLSGLVAVGLPQADVCGAGSSLDGTSVVTLTGGRVAPGSSCTFGVTIDVPAGALPGTYLNETSPHTATIGGVGVVRNAATDDLEVRVAPLLDKAFTDDPVPAGATVTLEFTITNPDAIEPATQIAFSDDLAAVLPGLAATDLPLADICGPGSSLTGTTVLDLANGSLGPGESCTFSTVLQVPAGVGAGLYTNVTSPISGLLRGSIVTGGPALDDLEVAAGPVLRKSFVNDPVQAGDTVTLEFTISLAEGSLSATDISFTDDLDAVLSGLVAVGLPIADVCGPGSQVSGTSTVELTGGALSSNTSCTFGITLQVPAGALPGTYPNLTSELASLVGGVPVLGPAAADDLTIDSGLSFEKSFTDDPVVAGGTVSLEFTLTSVEQTATATDLTFTDDLDAVLPGLAALGLPIADVCGPGSQISGTSLLTLTGGTLAPQSSCSFSVLLSVPGGAVPGEYPNLTSPVDGLLAGNPVTVAAAGDNLIVSSGLGLEKAFSETTVAPGGTVDLEFTVHYLDLGGDAVFIEFSDDLSAAVPGMTAIALPAAGFCGPGSQLTGTTNLQMTGGSLAPNTSCTFQATVQIPPTTLPGDYENVTSPITADVDTEGGGGGGISGPPARASIEVVAGLGFEKLTNGVDADLPPGPTVLVGGAVAWEYVVTNNTGATLTNIVVADNQGVAVSCPTDTLAPVESMTCTGAGVAQEGQYGNVGSVTGLTAGRLITATDPSHYFGLPVDFGDAPPGYPTLLADDGARHVHLPGLVLGAQFDPEPDGLPTPAADGDDVTGVDDEDGVAFTSPVIAGTDVDVEVTATGPGLLNAWIDFNADGDWTDAGEQVFTDQPLVAGVNALVLPLPSDAKPVATVSRWRLSSAGGDGITGMAADGEVEDHEVQIFAEADLALDKTDVWDPRMAGKPETFVLTITNNGPSMARDVFFEDTLPVETEFVTVEPAAPTCIGAAGVISCDLANLDAGEQMEVRFDVFIDPTFAGTIVNDATTGAATPDPDPANNAATEDSTVLALMDLVALPDINGNNSSEVAVLESGSLKLTVVDGGSGNVLFADTFEPDYVPIAMTAVPHFAGASSPELAILALDPTAGLVTVFVRDSSTGAPVRTHPLNPDYSPLQIVTVPNFGDSPADELAVLSRRITDGMPRVFVVDAGTGVQLKAFNFPGAYFPLEMVVVPDLTGGGVSEIAVAGRRGSDRAVQVTLKDAATGALAAQWFTDHTFLPLGMGLVPAWDGGVDRLAILGRRSNDGAVRLFVRRVTDGTRDSLYGHPLAFLPMDLEIAMDFDGSLADETAVLRWRPADGDTRTSVKDASDGSFLTGVKSDPAYYPLDLEIQPDWAATLADEVAVLGVRLLDEDLQVFLFDAGNGVFLGALAVP